MPIYEYTAIAANAQEESGTIEAISESEAATVLRARQLRVLRLEEPASKNNDVHLTIINELRAMLPVGLNDRVFFFQQLALMLRSGLTILQGLNESKAITESVRLQLAIEEIAEHIKSGGNFSQGMELQPGLFPAIAIQLVRSAETSGELDVVLERIAEHLEQKANTKRNLITSMIYPGIVMVSSIVVSGFLIAVVIPKFAEFFARSHKKLPPVTQAMLDLSDNMIASAPYLLVGLIVFFGLFSYTYSTGKGRLIIDAAFLKVPVIGTIITRSSMAQVTWAMSMLLKSGVTLLESLRVSRELVNNRYIKNALTEAATKVLNGRDLSGSLRHPALPLLVVNLSAVGEKAGSLDHVMGELGNHYDRELQNSIKRMSNAIEPLMILMIGGMVGFVYYAFFQAIFSLAG